MGRAKFEPDDGSIPHGAGQDPSGIREYFGHLPRALYPAMVMAYVTLPGLLRQAGYRTGRV